MEAPYGHWQGFYVADKHNLHNKKYLNKYTNLHYYQTNIIQNPKVLKIEPTNLVLL